MDDDWAGSWPNFRNITGIITPDIAAATIEIIIATVMTSANSFDLLQKKTGS